MDSSVRISNSDGLDFLIRHIYNLHTYSLLNILLENTSTNIKHNLTKTRVMVVKWPTGLFGISGMAMAVQKLAKVLKRPIVSQWQITWILSSEKMSMPAVNTIPFAISLVTIRVEIYEVCSSSLCKFTTFHIIGF